MVDLSPDRHEHRRGGETAAVAKHRFVRNHLSDYCCSPSRSFVCTALTGGLSRSPSVRLSVLTTTMFEQRRARAAAAAAAAAVLPPPPLLQHLQVQRKPPPFCCRNPNITLEIPNGTLRLLKVSRKRGFVWSGEISCHDLVKRPDALRLCRSRRCSSLPGFPAALRLPPSHRKNGRGRETATEVWRCKVGARGRRTRPPDR